MFHQHGQPLMNPGPFQAPPHEPPPQGGQSDTTSWRKRPLFPSSNPALAPRAIQPRPMTSTAAYGSEMGSPTHWTPGYEDATRGEPPRKRGRPSKVETERRKAAAEARGETYPPPRRPGMGRLRSESTPSSPAGVKQAAPFYSPNTNVQIPGLSKRDSRREPTPGRPPASDDEPTRNTSDPGPDTRPGPASRELPRPGEVRQILPSPQALHLMPRDTIPRIGISEPFVTHGLPMADTARRGLIDSATRAPPYPSVSSPQPSRTPGAIDEKQPQK